MSARTHRERAETVAGVLSLRTHRYRHPPTGDERTAAELIARETYPAELVEAARALLRLVRAESRYREGRHGEEFGFPECDEADAALALYPEEP